VCVLQLNGLRLRFVINRVFFYEHSEKKERERERERKNFLHRRENRTLGDIEKKRARDGERENNSVYFM
jgi:hypothetical protein